MPPRLRSDDGKHILIRPLAYCREKDIEKFAACKQFPIIPCNLCGSQDGLQRQAVKDMLQQWDRQFPGRIESIFAAVQNVAPSQLADNRLFNFADLEQGRASRSNGEQHRLDVLSL